jgi:hypothetical protein
LKRLALNSLAHQIHKLGCAGESKGFLQNELSNLLISLNPIIILRLFLTFSHEKILLIIIKNQIYDLSHGWCRFYRR